MLVFIGVSLFLLLRCAQVKLAEVNAERENADAPFYHRWWVALLASLVGVAIVLVSGLSVNTDIVAQLHNGELVGADYWRDDPLILSASMGFDNIIGLPELTEETVREAGGSWYGSLTCTSGEEPDSVSKTGTTLSETVERAYKGYADYDDGLPIVFSWPVATETVDVSDFQFTLNTGEVVFPHSAACIPTGNSMNATSSLSLAILATVV